MFHEYNKYTINESQNYIRAHMVILVEKNNFQFNNLSSKLKKIKISIEYHVKFAAPSEDCDYIYQ